MFEVIQLDLSFHLYIRTSKMTSIRNERRAGGSHALHAANSCKTTDRHGKTEGISKHTHTKHKRYPTTSLISYTMYDRLPTLLSKNKTMRTHLQHVPRTSPPKHFPPTQHRLLQCCKSLGHREHYNGQRERVPVRLHQSIMQHQHLQELLTP